MSNRPNVFLLMSLLLLGSLVAGAIVRVQSLDLAASIAVNLTAGGLCFLIEAFCRWFWPSLNRPARRDPALPDLLTAALLILPVGVTAGVAGAIVSEFYGVRGHDTLGINLAVMIVAYGFVVGLIRLVRHVVRLELARASKLPAAPSDHSPIAAPHA